MNRPQQSALDSRATGASRIRSITVSCGKYAWTRIRRAAMAAGVLACMLPMYSSIARAFEVERVRLMTQRSEADTVWTRFILDLTGPAGYSLESQQSDTHIRVFLPETTIGASVPRTRDGIEVIDSYRLEEGNGGTVLTVRVRAPVKIAQQQTLGPSGSRGHRIVIDLKQIGQASVAPSEPEAPADSFMPGFPQAAAPDAQPTQESFEQAPAVPGDSGFEQPPIMPADSGFETSPTAPAAEPPTAMTEMPAPDAATSPTPRKVVTLMDGYFPIRKPGAAGSSTGTFNPLRPGGVAQPAIPTQPTGPVNGGPVDPAIATLQQQAQRGDARAMYELADYYLMESRVEPLQQGLYEAEAMKYYRLAADLGYPPAQSKIGYLHHNGQIVAQNRTEAIAWYLKAAQGGDTLAQYNLGQIFREGDGIEKDFKKAAHWYMRAADSGHMAAQYALGLMYFLGMGVDEDPELGRKYMDMAAQQGMPEAIRFLQDPDAANR